MKSPKHVIVLLTTLALVLGWVLVPQAAHAAEAPDVTGADFYVTDAAQASDVDVLTVTGAAGDDLYIEVTQDGGRVASHLHYALGSDNASSSVTGQLVGVVSLKMSQFDPTSTYDVKAYSDRAYTNQLYAGTLTAVRATLGGTQDVIIGYTTRAAGEGQSFSAPATFTKDGVTYSNPTTAADGTISYTVDTSTAPSLTGSINYVDEDGTSLSKLDIEGITSDQPQTVSVEKVIAVGSGSSARFYRTLSLSDTVTATYGGTKDFTITCRPISLGNDGVNQFYSATINLVDQDGATLATDSLNVTGRYRWTAPSTMYLTKDGTSHTYELVGSDVSQYAAGILTLDPSKDGVTSGARTYTISYKDVTPPTAEATWTVRVTNGSVDPHASNRTISTEKVKVSASYVPEQSIDVDGTTYVPVKSTKASYSYDDALAQNANDPVLYVYYVPADYVAPGDRTVTVNYVNITGGATIDSKTYTLTPDDTEDLSITSPTSFVSGATTYVRLDGQDSPIVCGYYTKYDTYTVYYRDVNDDIAANTVITHFRVDYVDNGTTDNGTTNSGTGTNGTAGTGTTANGTATDADGQTVGLPTDGDLNTVSNGGDTATVVNGDGVDSNTARIDDNETPLASGQEGGIPVGVIAGSVCAAAALAILVILLVMRRKKHADTTADGQ
ncbi:MAG: hypothetical protein LKE50_02660 [Atopobiaceae bacterium]|jgi:hypothetical protein|nr:hypothetical protein [Atopobiaceae bacterium]